MSHSFSHLYYHFVWATKYRNPWLASELRPALFAYLGGLVRRLSGIPLSVNGIEDHVHLLVKLPPTVVIADCVQRLKSNSSRWLVEKKNLTESFCWQRGYGAFTVSGSKVKTVSDYIAIQEEHHKKESFVDEYRIWLQHHGVNLPDDYTWE